MIAEIVARLKAEATELTDVLVAEDLEAVRAGTAPRSGTAFVMPFRESGGPNELATGGFRQDIGVQVLVAFVTRRHDDAKGAKKVADWDTLRASIEGALAGWSITPENEPFELRAAHAGSLGNGASVYVQTWETNRYLETN